MKYHREEVQWKTETCVNRACTIGAHHAVANPSMNLPWACLTSSVNLRDSVLYLQSLIIWMVQGSIEPTITCSLFNASSTVPDQPQQGAVMTVPMPYNPEWRSCMANKIIFDSVKTVCRKEGRKKGCRDVRSVRVTILLALSSNTPLDEDPHGCQKKPARCFLGK